MANKEDDLLGDISSSLHRTGNALLGLKESDPEFYNELFGDSDDEENDKT